MDLATVNEIEHLHHDKCSENKSEVSRIDVRLLKNMDIVRSSVNEYLSTTAYCSHLSIFISIDEVGITVISVGIFWNEEISSKDKDCENNELKDSLTDYMFKHVS